MIIMKTCFLSYKCWGINGNFSFLQVCFTVKRFKELERDIAGISPKMLIKELKDLEAAGIVNRQTFNTVPITVEYSLKENALTLKPILDQMRQWAATFKEKEEKKYPR